MSLPLPAIEPLCILQPVTQITGLLSGNDVYCCYHIIPKSLLMRRTEVFYPCSLTDSGSCGVTVTFGIFGKCPVRILVVVTEVICLERLASIPTYSTIKMIFQSFPSKKKLRERSQYSQQATGWTTQKLCFDSRQEQEILLLSKVSRMALQLTFLVSWYRDSLRGHKATGE